MKKVLIAGLFATTWLFASAENARPTLLQTTVGTTQYIGIARASLSTSPTTNDAVWSVYQYVSGASGKWAYGLKDGIATYEVVKWADITATNVVYK